LSANETPLGSVAVSANVGKGKPVVVTVNDPATPTVKLVLLALVNTGAESTVSVKLCVPFGVIPFCAVSVIE
jgi:mRNA-degrading endonuclease toxin of MazEF toxin-antitoxin module